MKIIELEKIWIVFVAIAGSVGVGLIENSLGLGIITFYIICCFSMLAKLTNKQQ